jgi:hypothetical protein
MASDTPIFEEPDFGPDNEADIDEADIDEADIDEADTEDDTAEEDADESGYAVTDSDDDAVNREVGGVARSVLEHVARSIVDDPEAVVVQADTGRNGTRFDLHVAPGDMGRIIGKRGRVAQALRVLVRSAAARDGTDATVDIVD